MVKTKVQWGVLGTAGIAKKVGEAIKMAENAELVAVASRSKTRAKQWARNNQVEHAYGSYDELLADPRIDAVYIPLPPSMHAEWTIKAADQGKHVLCEKPLSVTVDEAIAMSNACKTNQVQLMDGVMWVHHDRTSKMLELIETEQYGLYHITNTGKASRYEYVKFIVETFGLSTEVEPVDSSVYPRSAPVPDCEMLENLNLKFLGLDPMTSWQESIQRYARSLK